MPRYSFKRKDVLSKGEVDSMIKRAERRWLKALIAMLYIYGCRITEALHMQRRAFWVDDGKLIANIPLLKHRGGVGPIEDACHILTVTLDTPFVDVLQAYLDTIKDPDAFVWPIGGTWGAARVKAWQEIKALNPKCSPHIFRHTRLTKLALKGANALVLMDWAGWTDPRPAQAYLHLGGKLAGEYADQVE